MYHHPTAIGPNLQPTAGGLPRCGWEGGLSLRVRGQASPSDDPEHCEADRVDRVLAFWMEIHKEVREKG